MSDRDRRDAVRRYLSGNPDERRVDRSVALEFLATALERHREVRLDLVVEHAIHEIARKRAEYVASPHFYADEGFPVSAVFPLARRTYYATVTGVVMELDGKRAPAWSGPLF